MKRFEAGFVLALLAGSVAPAAAQTPFPDIAPCHWAAEAVSEIAGEPEVSVEQAMASRYLAENSVRQVFEGLRCETPEWSRAFLTGEPERWPGEVGAVDFSLQVSDVQLAGDAGTVQVNLSLMSGSQRVDRSGQVELVFDEGIWRVSYDSLVQLDLALFR